MRSILVVLLLAVAIPVSAQQSCTGDRGLLTANLFHVPDSSQVTIEMQPVIPLEDSIRAVDDGFVVNAMVFQPNAFSLVLYQNDEFTDDCDEGYENGDPLVFQLYDATYGIWYDTQFTLNDAAPFNSEPVFIVDGLYLIDWMDGSTPLAVEFDEGPVAGEVPSTHRMGTAYPNPFRAETKFDLTVSGLEQNVVISVYNGIGQLIDRQQIRMAPDQSKVVTLDLANHANGVYIVTVAGRTFFNNQTVVLLK